MSLCFLLLVSALGSELDVARGRMALAANATDAARDLALAALTDSPDSAEAWELYPDLVMPERPEVERR